jgi:tRNA threonylcarbamoyladenosine biosynthesis protein TsaB
MNTLFIDTSNNKEIFVRLIINDQIFEKKLAQEKTRAEEVLILVDELLKEHQFPLEKLDTIKVNTGPGSFTGLRVGVAIANALSFSLGIPINDKKNGEIEIPVYNAI